MSAAASQYVLLDPSTGKFLVHLMHDSDSDLLGAMGCSAVMRLPLSAERDLGMNAS